MEYFLTAHAKQRISERVLSIQIIEDALRNPSKVSYNGSGKMLIKKLYRRKGTARLLLIIGEFMGDKLKVITVIDTSKVRKYL
jgi:hypothetical protein